MKFFMCSVLDQVSGQYGRPFCSLNEATAKRSFVDEVNRPDPQSTLYMHPGDFALYVIAEFDDSSAQLEVRSVPELLISGSQAAQARADAVSAANGAGTLVSRPDLSQVSSSMVRRSSGNGKV